ncbi:MAG: histidine kinase [Crocinitomicaceae bacterium]|nr:histidine kinase [Crocinitomicaceae bacterium]
MRLQKQSIFNYRMVQLIVLLFAVCALPIIYLAHAEASARSIFIDVGVQFGTLLIFLVIITVIQRFYHTNKVFGLPNLSSTALFSGLSLLIIYSLTRYLSDESAYSTFVYTTIVIRGALILLSFLLITAVLWIDQEHIHVQRIQSYAVDKEREAVKIELNSLQQKFKPHFLFNSLNSISALTVSDPKKAREMVQLLSDFMRRAVQEDDQELIPLSEEIDHLKRYIAIEQIRFGDRLNVTLDIEDDALEKNVPSLILQPIIENAIKYGLYGSLDQVEIAISIKDLDTKIDVVVTNPFDQDAQRASSGTGYGLTSIRKKIYLIYGQQQQLKTSSEDGQFTTYLTIPVL